MSLMMKKLIILKTNNKSNLVSEFPTANDDQNLL